MVPGDRSSTGGSTRSFDFNSQAGVLAVLGAIRVSSLSPVDRSELRDLVFLYSNGGGDQAVRNVLEERLAAFGITPDLIPTPIGATASPQVVPVYTPGFAGGRPAPVFTPTPAATAAPLGQVRVQTSVPVPVQPAPVTPPPVIPVQAPVLPTESVPFAPSVVDQVPVATAPVPPPFVPVRQVTVTSAAEVAVAATPTVAVASVPIVQPVVPVSITDQAAAPLAATPVELPVEPVSSAVEARLERIRTIKSEVNGRVGNPVNLVDINNELGREYMSALLEAMKLLSSASEAESSRAMSRLEGVFAQVLTLLDAEKNPVVSNPVVSPGDVYSSTPAIVPVVPIPTPPAPAVADASRAVVMPQVPPPLVTPTFPVRSQSVDEPAVQTWGQTDTFDAHVSVSPVPVPVIVPAPLPTQFSGVSPLPPVAALPVSPVDEVPVILPVGSVASSHPPLRTLSELPTADEVKNSSVAGDPLYTKEVDDGLNQLLSEWTLFKKSGLFGTGPNGRQHPLFIKIAPLQITLLLAGRFEGATQEIKQSITDYMNGWRYEQGIIYEQSETFEQYLRRVIRHIIDLQNKKRRS